MENDTENCGYIVSEVPGFNEHLEFFKVTRHFGRNLKPEQITIEERPFVTLRDKLPKSVTFEKAISVMATFQNLSKGINPTMTLGEVGFYPTETHDALYVSAESEYFTMINESLTAKLDGPWPTVEYKPRLVFAHVEKGCGELFEGISSFVDKEHVIIYFRFQNNKEIKKFTYADLYKRSVSKRLSSVTKSIYDNKDVWW